MFICQKRTILHVAPFGTATVFLKSTDVAIEISFLRVGLDPSLAYSGFQRLTSVLVRELSTWGTIRNPGCWNLRRTVEGIPWRVGNEFGTREGCIFVYFFFSNIMLLCVVFRLIFMNSFFLM